jgi:hypothetical protein
MADEKAYRKGNTAAYLVSVLVGGALSVSGIFGVFLLLQAKGRLPPPPIANNICIDEKLRFLRDRPSMAESRNLLVVGSSVAWRSIDAGAMVESAQDLQPLNGGFCSLRINQALYVGDWLLQRLPAVRSVVLVASPFDFEGCESRPAAPFDRASADEYVYGGTSKWPFYLRYFDVLSMLRNAMHISDMRKDPDHAIPLIFDEFGDGPLDTEASKPTLIYGAVGKLDRSCFKALGAFAKRMESSGREFAVVTTPLHPDWKEQFDAHGRIRQELRQSITNALVQTGGTYWDGDAKVPFGKDAFTDAVHLRWSAAGSFSRVVAEALANRREASGAGSLGRAADVSR